MMRALWSGVSGLQAHQVAMDVEGNNIANVNTTGFKYSRVDFADLLSQTQKVASAPSGSGGRNPSQVGLGATVAASNPIFSQGSTQTTDKPTDMAINGDGFFIVNGGNSKTGTTALKYTRSGNFSFDAAGNFVDNSGQVVQGWVRPDLTKPFTPTGTASNVVIDQSQTIPGLATNNIKLKANLTAGDTTNEKLPTSALDNTPEDPTTVPPTIKSQKEDMGVLFNSNGQAYNLQGGQGMWVGFKSATHTAGAIAGGLVAMNITINGQPIVASIGTNGNALATPPIPASSASDNATQLSSLINGYSTTTGVTATANGANITLTNNNTTPGDAAKNIIMTVTSGGLTATTAGELTNITAAKYQYSIGETFTAPSPVPTSATNTDPNNAYKIYTFHTTEDLRRYLQTEAQLVSPTADVIVNSAGQFTVRNQSSATAQTLNMGISTLQNTNVAANSLFVQSFSSLNGTLVSGTSTKSTDALNAATLTSAVDVFDQLGGKHTVTLQFRKQSPTQWAWSASVPSPSVIGDTTLASSFTGGTISFNQDSSLLNSTPTALRFRANTSSPEQVVNLNFGQQGTYNGVYTSAAPSVTAAISQDGYGSGNLQGVSIDQSGMLIGSFTNGRSIEMGQIALARFSNNQGLAPVGANDYIETSNSGQPTVNKAGIAGLGSVQSSALEMSNVDLSRSLTELIVVQRGYQANSKTISTADQLLQVLLQLKQ